MALVWAVALVLPRREAAAQMVDLGSASGFAVLAGAGITLGASGTTTIAGDIGSYPTATITGTENLDLDGTNHGGDAVTQAAKIDLAFAYAAAAGRAPTTTYAPIYDLGGQTLGPGVHNDPSSFGITGILTLDAGGDPDAVWIFQAGSTLVTASGSQVVLINGAQANRVFWQVGSSATLGTGTDFAGTLLAAESITLVAGASVEGRTLALNGAVTLDDNAIALDSTFAVVGNRVWFDADRDGIQDAGETNGVTGVPVALLDVDSNVVAATTTAAAGNYLFASVAPGSYRMRFDLSTVTTNVGVSPAVQGGDDARDSDATTGDTGGYAGTELFVVGSGATNLNVDLGLRVRRTTRAVLAEVWGEWTDGNGRVAWQTRSEWNTAGFFVYRVDPETGAETRLNEVLVSAAFHEAGSVYELKDPAIREGGAAIYRIEEIELSGGPLDLGTHAVAFAAVRPRPKAAKAILSTARLAMPKRAGPSAVLKVQWQKEGIYGVSLSAIAAGMGLGLADVQARAEAGALEFSAQGVPLPVLYDAARARLVFHGEPTDNWYTRTAVVLISQGAGLAMPRRDPGASSGATAFPVRVRFEQDRYPLDNARAMPEDFYYWDYVISGNATLGSRRFPLDLTGHAGGDVWLQVRLIGWSSSTNDPDHLAEFRFNGTLVGSAAFDGQDVLEPEMPVPAALVSNGVNVLSVTGVLQPGRSHSYFAVDHIDAAFARALVPLAGTAHFAGGGAAAVSAAAFAAPLALALDGAGQPTWIADENGELPGQAWAVPSGDERFAVIEAAAVPLLAPEAVDADPWFRAATNRIDYLVLTSRALEAAAQELADYRAGQGLRVGVATFEDVCDGLAGGLRTPEAIPELLAHAVSTWAEAPWLVVLAGNGHYDYLGALSNEVNHLPPLMLQTCEGLFAADGLLADATGDEVPDVAIGRLPARTAAELSAMIAKIKVYEAEFGSAWQNELVLAADVADAAGDFSAANAIFAALATAPHAVVERIDLDTQAIALARTNLLSRFNVGAGFIHYTGHGGVDSLSALGLLKAADVQAMTNVRAPVVVALSCLVGRFEAPAVEGLGELLMRQAQGGAAAVWCPSGMSLNAPATELAEAFYRSILQAGSGTLGLAILRARRSRQANLYTRDTLAIYNLLGDPALRIAGNRDGGAAAENFAQWRWERFAPAELADADSRGAPPVQFAEYALGGAAPLEAELPEFGYPLPEAGGEEGFILRWKRRIRRADVDYHLVLSHDLENWTENSPDLEEIGSEPDPDGVMETVRTRIRGNDAERIFLGVKAKKK